nr:MAG TPA: hypothetical protein [Caudoviricetes sp.]
MLFPPFYGFIIARIYVLVKYKQLILKDSRIYPFFDVMIAEEKARRLRYSLRNDCPI